MKNILSVFFIFASILPSSLAKAEQDLSDENSTVQYVRSLKEHMDKYWVDPGKELGYFECEVHVTQDRSGYIKRVEINSCPSGVVSNLILLTLAKASPMPQPNDPSAFIEDFTLFMASKR